MRLLDVAWHALCIARIALLAVNVITALIAGLWLIESGEAGLIGYALATLLLALVPLGTYAAIICIREYKETR